MACGGEIDASSQGRQKGQENAKKYLISFEYDMSDGLLYIIDVQFFTNSGPLGFGSYAAALLAVSLLKLISQLLLL